jgi:hypothetical protein
MLSVAARMLSLTALNAMLSVVIKPIMLSVVTLCVVEVL